MFSCQGEKKESALKYVPLSIFKAEVTNWLVLKEQFGIRSDEDFYNQQNWIDAKFSTGLVWTFDLKLRDQYKKYLGFSYPEVDYEVNVELKPFHHIYLLKYSSTASISPMKNYLDSGKYEKTNQEHFQLYTFQGTEKQLRDQMETGVVLYSRYKNIAINEKERVIIFSDDITDLNEAITAGNSGNNILKNTDFINLFENEQAYYSFRISTQPFIQIPAFSNLGRIQDYEPRLTEHMGLEIEELYQLKNYKSYWLGLSGNKNPTLDGAIIYVDENDYLLRQKIILEGRSFIDRSKNSDHFKITDQNFKDHIFYFQIQSSSNKKDIFYNKIVLGDLGFLLVYQSESIKPTSSSH